MNRSRGKKRSFLDKRRFSVVTWLIIANIVVSLVGFYFFSISKENYIALNATNILHGQYLWTLVTHMFAHANFIHLLVNMFVLFSLGGLCEKIIGRKRFFWFYIISGLFAGLLSVLLSGFYGNTELGARIFGDPNVYMVGASGAIFAIAGLYVLLLPRLRFMILFLPFFSLPAYIMVPLVLAVMWIASAAAGWPIGNVAHFGGFLAGILYGVFLRLKYARKIEKLQKMFK
jgi:membrane associated rhomboid family serine protease